MSGAKELIEKEEHFLKLNQELEIKTALLMQEVENVMRKSDYDCDIPDPLSLCPFQNYPSKSESACNMWSFNQMSPQREAVVDNGRSQKNSEPIKRSYEIPRKESPIQRVGFSACRSPQSNKSPGSVSPQRRTISPTGQMDIQKAVSDVPNMRSSAGERRSEINKKCIIPQKKSVEWDDPIDEMCFLSSKSATSLDERSETEELMHLYTDISANPAYIEQEFKKIQNSEDLYPKPVHAKWKVEEGTNPEYSEMSNIVSNRKQIRVLSSYQDTSRDRIIPDSLKHVESVDPDALNKFLNAKTKVLQKELDDTIKLLAEKEAKVVTLSSANKSLEEKVTRLMMQLTTMRTQYTRQETKSLDLTKRVENSEREYIALSKECDSLKAEIKTAVSRSSSASQRITRLIEENDKLKREITIAKQEDKELKESTRKENDALSAALRRIERQKKDAMLAFRKQTQLIDNIRRQNVLLAAEKSLDFTEKDYVKLLNWDSIPPTDSKQLKNRAEDMLN